MLPGEYRVKLSAGGGTVTQPLTVRMDPRLPVAPERLAEQLALCRRIADAMARDAAALRQVQALRARLAKVPAKAKEGALGAAVAALERQAAALESGGGDKPKATDLTKLNGDLAQLYGIVEGTDAAPTTQARAAFTELDRQLAALLARWREIEGRDVPALHRQLQAAGE